MKYQHLSVEEREEIQAGLWKKESTRSIAERLGRSPASISREITKNHPLHRVYFPRLAHERTLAKRKERGRKLRLKSQIVRRYVVRKLKEGYSPEQNPNFLPNGMQKRNARQLRNQLQFLLTTPALDFGFAFRSGRSIRILLGIYDPHDFLCACVMAADAVFVFRKSAFDVCRNTGIEGPIFTLYEVHEIHKRRIQHFAVVRTMPLVAPTGLARDT